MSDTDVKRQIYQWFEADPYRDVSIKEAIAELNQLCPSLCLSLEMRGVVAHIETASSDPGEIEELVADLQYLTGIAIVAHARVKVEAPHPFLVFKIEP